MQTTSNLELKLYDGTDAVNLITGYNASMQIIDTRDGQITNLISNLQALVNGYNARISALETALTKTNTVFDVTNLSNAKITTGGYIAIPDSN